MDELHRTAASAYVRLPVVVGAITDGEPFAKDDLGAVGGFIVRNVKDQSGLGLGQQSAALGEKEAATQKPRTAPFVLEQYQSSGVAEREVVRRRNVRGGEL